MERLVRVSSFGIQSGATAGTSSKASVEAQAGKYPGEDSAKTRQNPRTQPKPKTLRRLGRTPARNPRLRLCKESNSSKVSAMVFISSTNVKAHPPLGARANVERKVEVVITGNHVNRAAPSGWMERLVLRSYSVGGFPR